MSVALGAAIIGGLGSLYGQYRAGKEAQKGRRAYRNQMGEIVSGMEENVAGQREDIARYLEPDAHRNYMESAEAQSVMEGARGSLQEMARRMRGGVARSGGTMESAVAGQTAAAKGYADVVNRLAGHGTMYTQMARRSLTGALQGWRGAQHGVSGMKANVAGNMFNQSQQMAQGHAQSGQNFLNAMIGVGGTDVGEKSIRSLLPFLK
jgi:hypothetical protein